MIRFFLATLCPPATSILKQEVAMRVASSNPSVLCRHEQIENGTKKLNGFRFMPFLHVNPSGNSVNGRCYPTHRPGSGLKSGFVVVALWHQSEGLITLIDDCRSETDKQLLCWQSPAEDCIIQEWIDLGTAIYSPMSSTQTVIMTFSARSQQSTS